MGGELPEVIRHKEPEEAENVLKEYIDIFGDDFYLELQDHGLEKQTLVNARLLKLAQKYDRKVIATNDVHYVNKEDYDAHHILICLNTGKDVDDKSGMHYTGQEYLKTPVEMAELFADVPEALANTREVVDKIEDYEITTRM